MTKDQIRAVLLAAGFTIKDGQTDLEPYVFEAAGALLRQYEETRAGDQAPADAAVAPGVNRIWHCKIGGQNHDLPEGADAHMRRAVNVAYEQVTGFQAQFFFSGWGGTLTKGERNVHDAVNPSTDRHT